MNRENNAEFLGTCDAEANFFCVGGKDLYRYRWNPTGRCITVLHPTTKSAYTFTEYTADLDGTLYTFACGPLPGGKTAFYEIT